MLYVGADNHAETSHVTVVDEKGNVVRRKKIESLAEEVSNAPA